MLTVRNILVALLCVSPLCLFWDGLIVQGLVSGIAAAMVALTARTLRPGETEFLISVARPALIAAAVPVLWVAFQILPFGVFAHPIWKSAAAALHQPLLGSISVDPAASVVSLGDYLLLAAVTFVSTAVGIDRHRAEWILFALCIAATVASLIVLGHQFGSAKPTQFAFAQATECVSLGTIITATICLHAVERYGIRRHQAGSGQQLRATGLQTFFPGLAAFLVCGLALSLLANRATVFATACGLLTLASQAIIRRFGLGWWGIAGVAVPALVIAFVLVGAHPARPGMGPPLAFASGAFSSHAALSQRMMDDAPLGGIGAGTFNPALSLSPLINPAFKLKLLINTWL